MGLRDIDRVAATLIPATTSLGQSYARMSEVYAALLTKRQKELGVVAKLVGASRRRATKAAAAVFRSCRCPPNASARR